MTVLSVTRDVFSGSDNPFGDDQHQCEAIVPEWLLVEICIPSYILINSCYWLRLLTARSSLTVAFLSLQRTDSTMGH